MRLLGVGFDVHFNGWRVAPVVSAVASATNVAPEISSVQQALLHTRRERAANSPKDSTWLEPSLLVSWAARLVSSRRRPGGNVAASAGSRRSAGAMLVS